MTVSNPSRAAPRARAVTVTGTGAAAPSAANSGETDKSKTGGTVSSSAMWITAGDTTWPEAEPTICRFSIPSTIWSSVSPTRIVPSALRVLAGMVRVRGVLRVSSTTLCTA